MKWYLDTLKIVGWPKPIFNPFRLSMAATEVSSSLKVEPSYSESQFDQWYLSLQPLVDFVANSKLNVYFDLNLYPKSKPFWFLHIWLVDCIL